MYVKYLEGCLAQSDSQLVSATTASFPPSFPEKEPEAERCVGHSSNITSSCPDLINHCHLPDRPCWPAVAAGCTHGAAWTMPPIFTPWAVHSTLNLADPVTWFNQRKVAEVVLCQFQTWPFRKPGSFGFCAPTDGVWPMETDGESTWRAKRLNHYMCQLSPAFQPPSPPGTRQISGSIWTFQAQPPSNHSPSRTCKSTGQLADLNL